MSAAVLVTITCDGCGRTAEGQGTAAGLSVSWVRQTAVEVLGWVVGVQGDRCLDCRQRPLRFHPFAAGSSFMHGWERCATCRSWENPDDPKKPAHREEAVRQAASLLRSRGRYAWTWR